MIALLACRPDPEPPPVAPSVGTPTVELAGGAVRQVAVWRIDVDPPMAVTLTVSGPEGSREVAAGPASHHEVTLLGNRPDTDYDVHAELSDGGAVPDTRFHTESLPDPFPEFVVGADDPARREPGWLLVPVTQDEGGWIVVLDQDDVPVYLQAIPFDTQAVSVAPTGELAMVDGFTLRLADWLGRTVVRWTATPSEPEDVAVPFEDFHHEIAPQPDGTVWALSYEHVDVPDYPTSYDHPDELGPATIRNDFVVHLDRDGAVRSQVAMLDLLDPHHIGFGSLEPAPSGALDWVHTNAVVYDAATEEVTLSLRHQDAVVRFSAATGALKWIFGSPYGWDPAFAPYLLTPTEDFVWPTHQHGIEVGDDGVLRMFDNGNDGRDTPYHASGEGGEKYSRILEVRVDEAARTVSPAGEFAQTTEGPVFSSSLGNADRLPVTGNRLGTWGTVPLVVEFAPDGTPVHELAPLGWRVDRAVHLPTLP